MYLSYTTMVLKLALFFEQGEKKNGFHYYTYCNDCLKYYLAKKEAEAPECAHVNSEFGPAGGQFDEGNCRNG